MNNLRKIFEILKYSRYTFVITVSISFILIFIENIRPLIMGSSIDSVLNNDISLVFKKLLIISLLIIIGIILDFFQSLLVSKAIYRTEKKMNCEFYNKILFNSDEKTNLSSMNEILISDISSVSKLSYQIIDIALFNTLSFIFITYICININVHLTVIVLTMFPIMILINNSISRRIKIWNINYKNNIDEINNELIQVKIGLPIVKVYKVYNYFTKRMNLLFDKSYVIKYTIAKKLSLKNGLYEFMNYSLYFLILSVGVYFIHIKKITVGEFIAFNSYSSILSNNLNSISNLIYLYKEYVVSYERINAINFIKKDAVSIVENSDYSFKLNDVFFEDNGKTILKSIEIELPQKGLIFLIGDSGSGKTSFLKLLLRLSYPESGHLIINRNYLDVGYVQQNPNIFEDTVYNNIVLGRNINDKKLFYEADMLNARYLVERYITENNRISNDYSISGGEKQKMCFLRAIICSPKVYILDEFDNALDRENSFLFMNKARVLSEENLVIITTHNLTHIHEQDKCICFSNGEIVKYCKFSEIDLH